jgi:hypothetical protein
MTPYIRNNQNHLAEEHRRFENYLLQESRIALVENTELAICHEDARSRRSLSARSDGNGQKVTAQFCPQQFCPERRRLLFQAHIQLKTQAAATRPVIKKTSRVPRR